MIIGKYADHPVMNSYLKKLETSVASPKANLPLCLAYLRDYVTLTNGGPIKTVSKMPGHKSVKTTQHYAKIADKKVSGG